MNKLLEKAFAAAAMLPEDEQEALATIILDELSDEAAWQEKFERGADKLSALANLAVEQDKRGESLPLAFPPER